MPNAFSSSTKHSSVFWFVVSESEHNFGKSTTKWKAFSTAEYEIIFNNWKYDKNLIILHQFVFYNK